MFFQDLAKTSDIFSTEREHTMAAKLKVCILLISLFAVSLQAAQGIEGIWLGTLNLPNGSEMRLAVTVTKQEDGSLAATMNSIDQGSGELPFDEVSYDGDSLRVVFNAAGIRIQGKPGEAFDTMEARFQQGPGRFPITFEKVQALPGLSRTQTPERPFPYIEEEVEYYNEDADIKLAGTLTMPKSGGPFPAVILLTGSGAQNRDEEVFGHRPFLVLSDYLTRQGIAVLRADDRGVGGSEGDFQLSTTADFADDALAGIKYLKSRKEIKADQIGLAGHSEGGMMAQIASVKSKDVAFIISMAGPGIGMSEILTFQRTRPNSVIGMEEADIELLKSWYSTFYGLIEKSPDRASATESIREAFGKLSDDEKTRIRFNDERLEGEINAFTSTWMYFALKFNPSEYLKQINVPVLAINGEKDSQVVADKNLEAIEKALKKGGNKDFTIKELKGLNHLFQTSETGAETEYQQLEETFSPEAMKIIGDWILLKTK